MLVASLSDPHRQFVALSFRVNRFRDGRVGIGRHPASLHPPAIDVEGSDAAADGNCQSVPNAVVQLVVERFDPGQAQVSVVQSDLVLPAGALQLQKPTPGAIKRTRKKRKLLIKHDPGHPTRKSLLDEWAADSFGFQLDQIPLPRANWTEPNLDRFCEASQFFSPFLKANQKRWDEIRWIINSNQLIGISWEWKRDGGPEIEREPPPPPPSPRRWKDSNATVRRLLHTLFLIGRLTSVWSRLFSPRALRSDPFRRGAQVAKGFVIAVVVGCTRDKREREKEPFV